MKITKAQFYEALEDYIAEIGNVSHTNGSCRTSYSAEQTPEAFYFHKVVDQLFEDLK